MSSLRSAFGKTTWYQLVTALLTALVLMAWQFGFFTTLQASLTDRFFTTEAPPAEIVIVAIDEATLRELGQWPFSRDTHATLLENLATARVVGFDIIFAEVGAGDERLAAAMADFSGTIVLPQVLDEQTGLITEPLSRLAAHSELGFVNTRADRDGVVRQVDLLRNDLKSFDGVIAEAMVERDLVYPDHIRSYFFGPAKTFTTLSYIDVYNGRVPSELFTEKVVLIGASAAGLGDTFQTPFGLMPGVEVHANTIATIVSGEWLVPAPIWLQIFLLLAIAMLTYLMVSRLNQASTLTAAGLVLFVGILVAAYLAFAFGYLLPHLYMLLLFVLLTGALLLVKYVFEQAEKLFIRRGFSQYVASEVVDEIARHPEKLTLGGETKTLSILFSDIRGFTTISEQLTPAELMEQLNEYLEEMSEAVMQRRGLVDKYIGDAVMAFWGAPLTNTEHAVDACESVLDMMDALKRLNARWQANGKPPFAIGVGISTGEVVVGNMGSARRFNYSIIGDEVNFAARIEGLTKEYGVACIIGERTNTAIAKATHLRTRELDDVMVKGKKEPRRIYELITEPVDETKEAVLVHFAAGRAAYIAGDFRAAIAAFEAALALDPKDGPSRVFMERSKLLLADPPATWNGVFAFTTK